MDSGLVRRRRWSSELSGESHNQVLPPTAVCKGGVCASPMSRTGPLGEAFTKHEPPWGHERHLRVLIAHNLQMGFGCRVGSRAWKRLELGVRGCQDIGVCLLFCAPIMNMSLSPDSQKNSQSGCTRNSISSIFFLTFPGARPSNLCPVSMLYD